MSSARDMTNLILVGPMGAGKSAIGRRLAARFGLEFVDADQEIERRCGATVAEIFAREGESGFRRHEGMVLAELLAGSHRVIATGGGAVLDAGSRASMRSRGFVVHLQVSMERQLARLAGDRTRPLLAGADPAAVLRELAVTRAPLYAEVADLAFDTDAWTDEQAAGRLAELLSTRWHPQGVVA